MERINVVAKIDYHFNMESMYEGGFCVDDDAGLEAVMNYFDECVWPIYNVIVKEDSPVVNAGEYPMHIVDAASLEGCYLKEIIRAHKSELKRTIENANKSA